MTFVTTLEARIAAMNLANRAHNCTDERYSPSEATEQERIILRELQRLSLIEDAARSLVTNMPDKILLTLRTRLEGEPT